MNINQKMIESMQRSTFSLMRTLDGEPQNINPLTEIPTAQMRLFKLDGFYFDTEEELQEYVKNNNADKRYLYTIEYMGTVLDRCDVMRITQNGYKGRFFTAVNRDGYGIYNEERSFYTGKFVWEYFHGDIKSVYTAFRERGIEFEEDIYGEIEKRDKNLMKMVKEHHLFNY